MPLDFTKKFQHNRTYTLVQSVREIMNAIQGPKTLGLNPQTATSIPLMNSEDGQQVLFNPTLLTSGTDRAPLADLYAQDTTTTWWKAPNFINKGHPMLYVRRGPGFAVGIDAVVVDQETYANNAARNDRNAPDRSVFGLNFIFSNWTPNPTSRALCIKYLHKWLRQNTVIIPADTTITVWKLSTLNQRIAAHQPFDANTTLAFPRDAIPLDLTQYHGAKLAALGKRIIDLSDTFEGQIVVNQNTDVVTRDVDLAKIFDDTLIKQDIDFGLFLAFPPILAYQLHAANATPRDFDVYDFDFDPVEAIFSYLTVKKYEQNDATINSMLSPNPIHVGYPAVFTDYGVNVLLSYRLALSYLIQEAKKQIRYWLSNAGLILNQSYSLATIKNYLTGSVLFNVADDSVNYNVDNALAWIPYEYVKYYNDVIEFDNFGYEAGKNGIFVPKKVRKPRSYTLEVDQNFILNIPNQSPYFQKYGLPTNLTYDLTNPLMINAWPISLIDTTYGNGHIYKTIGSNSDNIIHYDHVDNSEYFPEPDIVSDI